MEGVFPQNVYLRIIIQTSPLQTLLKNSHRNNENKLNRGEAGFKYEIKVLYKCRFENITQCITLFFSALYLNYISMLKRSHSMEFDSDQYKPEEGKEPEENVQSKKICNSGQEEGKPPEDTDEKDKTSQNRSETYRRYSQAENPHVTQSRSIFSHEDSFVYGNPKEEIKSIENPAPTETVGAPATFETNPSNALDLSCKKDESSTDGTTYQNYQSFPRSNLEIKLVNPQSKKPSLPEQLQIAKIQQQQRRSMQQQQKLLQQMRRSLDSKTPTRQEQTNSKNVKYYGNSTTNHEQSELDNHARVKDEFHPPGSAPGAHFPQFPYPYFDPAHPKELPDNHPILPLLDPVYFSALYNAHGFLPPSSPSIAAAFIGTLQDALPKLPMMFPSTSSNNSPLLPQKGGENPN